MRSRGALESLTLQRVDKSSLLLAEESGKLGPCPPPTIGSSRSTQGRVLAKGNVKVRAVSTVGVRVAREGEAGSEKLPGSGAALCTS